MDKASIFGVVVGSGLVVGSILLGSSLMIFINVPGLLIVGGGTFAATSIAFPTEELKHMFGVVRRVFNDPGNEMVSISQYLLQAMRILKKDGPLALEDMATKAPTEPLKKGLQLIADGADVRTIQEILATEQKYMEEHHRIGQKIFNEMGKYAPAFGMVGTLIGLVQMLANMSDPESIGPAMAVALLTTFYGAVLANLIFLPMVAKLDRRIVIEVTQIQLAIVGLMSMHGGDTAAIMKDKMQAFIRHEAVPDVKEAARRPDERLRLRRRRRVGAPAEEGAPLWTVTFGDMMSLLLTFFILLFSMSELKVEKFMLARHRCAKRSAARPRSPRRTRLRHHGGRAGRRHPTGAAAGGSEIDEIVDAYMTMITERLSEFVEGRGLEESITIERDGQGVYLRMETGALFASGSATLQPEGRAALVELAEVTSGISVRVLVSGHTDNEPVVGGPFPSNWELSAARAAGVARTLVEHGQDPVRVRAESYGEYRPIADNDTPEGRAKNRRVELMYARSDIIAAVRSWAPVDPVGVDAAAGVAEPATPRDHPLTPSYLAGGSSSAAPSRTPANARRHRSGPRTGSAARSGRPGRAGCARGPPRRGRRASP